MAAPACATVLLCTMKSATRARTFASGCKRLVGVDRQFREHVVLAGEDREHLVEFLQRRVGALDDFAEVAAAPGEAGAEFVEDDREALLFGQPVDVAEQVDVDRARGVLHRAAGTGRRLLPWRILCSGGGSGVPSTRGCVGRQSTYFSPISACGRIVQLASERKSLKPGFSMLSTTAALPCGVGVTEPTVPTLTPSILTFSPEIRLPASSKIARTV